MKLVFLFRVSRDMQMESNNGSRCPEGGKTNFY